MNDRSREHAKGFCWSNFVTPRIGKSELTNLGVVIAAIVSLDKKLCFTLSLYSDEYRRVLGNR